MYVQWSKTTEAENQFWMPQYAEDINGHEVYAVDAEKNKTIVGVLYSEEDADWITAVHGCFGDLVRRMHQALDESDRLDSYVDEQEHRIAGLEQEAELLERDCEVLTEQLIRRDETIRDLEYQLHEVGL